MLPRQNFFFQDLCAASLVDASHFKDLSRVYIRISASSHDSDTSDHTFVDLDDATLECEKSEKWTKIRYLYRRIDCIIYFDWRWLIWSLRTRLHCCWVLVAVGDDEVEGV